MRDGLQTTFREMIDAGHLQVGDGYRTKQAEHGQPGLPILRVAEVLDGRIDPKFEDFVSDNYRPAMGPKISRPGDIVLTTKGTVGRVAIMPPEDTQFVYSPQVCFFRTAPASPLVGHYLYYWFKSEQFWSQARSLKSQTDMADYINLADIRSLRILLPPKPVQQCIVAILGALDDKIAVNRQIECTTYELAQAMFSHAAQYATRRVVLRDIIDLHYGKALPEGDRQPGRVPVFGSNGRSGWHSQSLSSGPGIIVGRKGANAGSISWSQGPFWVIDTAFFVDAASRDTPLEYLYFLLQEVGLRSQVGDSAIPGLNREIALACAAMIPSDDVIRVIASEVRPLLELRAFMSHESASLAALRDTLLPKLMSGNIQVRDAERIVGDAT